MIESANPTPALNASRRNWLQRIETFLIVTVISVLVWLYADVQNVRQFTGQHVRILLVPQAGQDLAIEPDVVRDIALTFRASNRQMQRFTALIQQLSREGRAIHIPVDAPADGASPDRQLDVASLLAQSELSELGLNILSTDPGELPARIEEREQVQLPVQVRWEGMEIAGEPAFDPKRAVVTLPVSLANAVRDTHLVADLTTVNLSNVPDGVPVTRTVALRLAPQVAANASEFQLGHTAIDPVGVTVTFTPQRQKKTVTIDRIPIALDISPVLLRRFNVDVPDDQLILSRVEITGPTEVVNALVADRRLKAWITLSAEDLQNGVKTVMPRLELPPGVSHSTLESVDIVVRPKE